MLNIKLINHASINIYNNEISILTDPWYSGNAFHKGWSLLFENDKEKIEDILKKITHIWISHEHPDHFSIKFFKDYKDIIIKYKLIILFQKTLDKRVITFLQSNKINTKEIDFNRYYELSKDFKIKCIKDGFYDSGLLMKVGDQKILNLNDCEVSNTRRAKIVHKITGNVDYLFTQFSYAAWKGGEENIKWRRDAAEEKIKTLQLQYTVFKPKYLIPFASFIYFSNKNNFYMNDSMNTLNKLNSLQNLFDNKLVFLKPYMLFDEKKVTKSNIDALEFWNKKFNNINNMPLLHYESIKFEDLKFAFKNYIERIKKNNNFLLIKIISAIPYLKLFKPVFIRLHDIPEIVKIDISKEIFSISQSKEINLTMHSESLLFLFKNTFGFDTLTVNGCLEEVDKNGFINATKSLAIENLNNLGIKFSFMFLLNLKLIMIFLNRIARIKMKFI